MAQRQPPKTIRKRPPKLLIIDSANGQIIEAPEVRIKNGGQTISSLYGPNWTAVPTAAWRALAQDPELTGADLRVLMFLLSKLETGNTIRLRAIDAVNEMRAGRGPNNRSATADYANIARSIRKLCARQILIPRKGTFGWQVNPNYLWRGDPTGMVGKRRDGELVLLT